MAARIASSPSDGSAFTVAISVARFTFASRTPDTFARAFSTRPAQEAQVMPTTGRVQSETSPADAAGTADAAGRAVVVFTASSLNLTIMSMSRHSAPLDLDTMGRSTVIIVSAKEISIDPVQD